MDDYKEYPIGVWDIKANSWKMKCVGLSAFSLWKLGLCEIKEIWEPGTYEIDSLYGDGSSKAFKIKIPGTLDEWLIVENRQKTGLDGLFDGIPNAGLVMYHYDNGTPYNNSFNDNDLDKKHFGLKVFNNRWDEDSLNAKAVWSQESGNTEMNCRNSPDNFPLFVKNSTGSHIVIRNIGKSGPRMAFELAFENSSPDHMTDARLLDFGNVRKGLSKTLPCDFFYNGNGIIQCQFTSGQSWIGIKPSVIPLSRGTVNVTVETAMLEFGPMPGSVKFKTPYLDGELPIRVDVTFPVGDVDADYHVGHTDFEAFKNAYSSRKGDGSFAEMADFDGSGAVDIGDFFLISRYWGD